MKRLFIIFLPISAFAGTCNYPSNTAGCPSSNPGVQGSTTPTAVANSGGTFNGVTTASIDMIWGVPYTSTGYVSPGGAQSSEDITYYFPHEAFANPTQYEIVFCAHQGGGSTGGTEVSGCWGDNTIVQENVFEVQRFLGTPNRVGGKGIIVAVYNYKLTNFGAIPNGPSLYPKQPGDAKCALWFTLAQSTSVVPGNRNLIGSYGPSWGGVMAWWMVGIPDSQVSPSCLASPPAVDPKYVAVMAWDPMAWFYPFGNALYDNTDSHGTQAMEGQMNSTTESVMQSTCSLFSPTCDPAHNISQANMATYNNVTMLFQFGTPGLDIVVEPNWGSGATQGGNLYQTVSAFDQLSPALHPFTQVLNNCVHVCDIGTISSKSQIDAFNFLLGQSNTGTASSGMGGTF